MGGSWGAVGSLLGGLEGVLGRSWSLLGRSWAVIGGIGESKVHLSKICSPLGREQEFRGSGEVLAALGSLFRSLGWLLAVLGALLGRSWGLLGPLGPILVGRGSDPEATQAVLDTPEI